MTTVNDCYNIALNNVSVESGTLTFIEQIGFDIKRVYYISNIPYDAERGAHAHKELYQLITAINGQFTIELDDTINTKTIRLTDGVGLIVVPGIWRNIKRFTATAVCLVLASEVYKENDYIRDYEQFKQLKNEY